MTLRYDLDSRSLYIGFSDGAVARTRELDGNTFADYDADGKVTGVEVVSVDHPWALAEALGLEGLPAGAERELVIAASAVPQVSVA